MKKLYKSVIGRQINKKAECLYHLIGKTPGFDVIKAVEKLGGQVIFDETEMLAVGVDAKINTFPDDENRVFNIICSKQQSDVYTRFCIAHELGHLFLHMTKKDEDGKVQIKEASFFKDNDYSSLYEWEAEEFAACFLMPEEEFRDYVRKLEGDIKKLAEIFKVPPQSVITRCKRLEII